MFFGAELENPGAFAKVMLALFGKFAMGVTRKQMARDLEEIAAKAEGRDQSAA
jgi:hypothetical protein